MELNKTADKILMYLKMNGPQTSTDMAKAFGMTSEGMRQHLMKLEENELLQSENVAKGVGRPTTIYRLSQKATNNFPDNHAPLAAQLLDSVQEILGKEVLELIMDAKRKNDFERYENVLSQAITTEDKLLLFTEMRNKEGYMTQLDQDEQSWLFIENHCPICTAARKCEGFCSSEIENIRNLLGDKIEVEREDHAIQGARRCSYRIKKSK